MAWKKEEEEEKWREKKNAKPKSENVWNGKIYIYL